MTFPCTTRLLGITTAMFIAMFAAACGGSVDGVITGDPAEATSSGVAAPAGSSTSASSPATPASQDDGYEGEGDRPAQGGGAGSADAGPGAPPPAPSGSADAGATPPPPPPPPPPSGAAGATLIQGEVTRELSAVRETTYTHTTYVDESKGVFDFDCSGFVGYAVDHGVGTAMTSLRAATGPRPLAKDFEAYFESIGASASKGGWSRVGRAMDLVPGDVIAWIKPDDVVSANTGHVLIVRGGVRRSSTRADVIIVPITDSTSTPHGAGDSRAAGQNGLGTGEIGILVDASGAPIGYHWSTSDSSKDELTSVALGHVL